MGSDDDAVAFLSKTGLSRLDLSLIVGALPDKLGLRLDVRFPERSKRRSHPRQAGT